MVSPSPLATQAEWPSPGRGAHRKKTTGRGVVVIREGTEAT